MLRELTEGGLTLHGTSNHPLVSKLLRMKPVTLRFLFAKIEVDE